MFSNLTEGIRVFQKKTFPIDFEEFSEALSLCSCVLRGEMTSTEKLGEDGIEIIIVDDNSEEIASLHLIDNPINQFAILLFQRYRDDVEKFASILKRVLGIYEIMKSPKSQEWLLNRMNPELASSALIETAATCSANEGDRLFDEGAFFNAAEKLMERIS